MKTFTFPKWTNQIKHALGAFLLIAPLYLIFVAYYGGSPLTTDVGYMPDQPVDYSHALHAGELGIDCRYCHNTVEEAAHSAIPPTETCMNCHQNIRAESAKLIPIKESHVSGMPIEWVRVHDLPDYVFFNHSAHVRRGVGCVSCHGRVDKMEKVYQEHTLSMGWCLDCHREPEKHLRELNDITEMVIYPTEEQEIIGKRVQEQYNIDPPTDCLTCHR